MTTAAGKAPGKYAGYYSGFCGVRAHERCRGIYAGTECTCDCHRQPAELPPPEVLGEIAAALTEVAIAAAVARHCPTCTCEGHE